MAIKKNTPEAVTGAATTAPSTAEPTPSKEQTQVEVQETDGGAPPPAPRTAEEEAHEKFGELQDKLSLALSTIKDVTLAVKNLQKDHTKLLKATQKKRKGGAANAGAGGAKRSPSGFAKPTRLSPELCKFLGQPEGTELARTDVTRMLNSYIKEHKLQSDGDKRNIDVNKDPELKALMNLKEGAAPVTYFNLQTHIKEHFIK